MFTMPCTVVRIISIVHDIWRSMQAKSAGGHAADPSEDEAKAAFAVLRPLCVEVMRAPSLETLQALDGVVGELSSLPPQLVDYVALPLRMIVRRVGR